MADFPPAGAYPVGDYPAPLETYAGSAIGVFLADAIDPETRDYRSIARGVDPVEAQALEALMVQRRTGSAVMDDGISLADLKIVDDSFDATVKAEIAYAWRRLIADQKLEIVSVTRRDDETQQLIDIRIKNLTAQAGDQGRTLTLPLLQLQGAV